MKTPFTGGCQCGAVRYECTAKSEEIQMFNCHCRDCQQFSGGGYTPVVYFPLVTFRLTRGDLKYFTVQSEPGPHRRGFCGTCGARVTGGESPGSPGIGVTAASLDDPSWFKPAVEMWVSDAQPWARPDEKLPAFAKFPPG